MKTNILPAIKAYRMFVSFSSWEFIPLLCLVSHNWLPIMGKVK